MQSLLAIDGSLVTSNHDEQYVASFAAYVLYLARLVLL